ncbi:MAG: hypothetical protein Q7R30_17900 [Acidobacteriota bacterium]|nr:hypothetical protein [Acidobacteriota bacterium]
MSILNLFSRRQKRLRGEFPDVYQYTDLPNAFRVQLVFVLGDLFGENDHQGLIEKIFKGLHDDLAREYGVFNILEKELPCNVSYRWVVFQFLGTKATTEQVIDVIELMLSRAAEERYRLQNFAHPVMTVQQTIDELNQRFREHGIGYQYESGMVQRVDSEFLHSETVKPALQVLAAKRFAGANHEFLNAHEHYRHGRYGEALNECLKAFESTLKVICEKQKWPVQEKDTAKSLLEIVFKHGLVPDYMQSEFSGLRAVLEAGVPTTRNRESGHGAGSVPKKIPVHLASFALHLTAASILFLTESEKQLG